MHKQRPGSATKASSSSHAVQSSRASIDRHAPAEAVGSASTSGVSSSNSSNSNASAGPAMPNHHPSNGAATNGSGAATSNGENYFSTNAMNSLREAFKFFDIDQDGRITSGELQKVLKFLGTKVTEHEVKLMIADVDTDGNGTVEFNEFLKMMKKYYTKNEEEHSEDADMWEAFKAFDHNGDNFIDFAEIKKTMHFLGEEVSDEDVRSMIAEADVDNDGRINFEEFKKMMAVMQQKAGQS